MYINIYFIHILYKIYIDQIELADARLNELKKLTSSFILRRTSEINKKFLPPKIETTIFCRLSNFQINNYKDFCKSTKVHNLLKNKSSGGIEALKIIMQLKQLCSHPILVNDNEQKFINLTNDEIFNKKYSGKITFIDELLKEIDEQFKLNKNEIKQRDRIVLVSTSTKVLDLLEKLCKIRNFNCIRLDGSTVSHKRQNLVNRFNNLNGPMGTDTPFVFLLSSKAGGCGLNLVGANRLVLIDPDWNPAVDAQAQARIW